MKKNILFIIVFLFVITTFSYAQSFFPNKIQNKLYTQLYEQMIRENADSLNSYPFALQPYNISGNKFENKMKEYFELNTNSKIKSNNIFHRTLRTGNMIALDDFRNKNTTVAINPLFQFEGGKSSNNTIYSINRGVKIDINFNDKVFISSSMYESLSKFPTYMNHYIDSLTVVPGMGKARNYVNGESLDYAMPIGFIGYKPNRNFYFELGNDKNFIGNGFRSLMLSDVAYSYPYFKMQTFVGKFTFQTLWAQFVDASRNWQNTNGYDKKYGVFNTVSYTGFKNVEINLFQSVIWNNKDSLGNKREQEWGYFVPIIFFNSLNFNNGSPDNSVMGIDASYTIKKNTIVYGQFILDDFNVIEFLKGKGYFQNKFGVQLGIKSFKPLGLKNAFARAEFNIVRPFTYANKTPAVNYTHYNEALAHPLGANFKEILLDANYKVKRFLFGGTFVIATYGADSSNSHWGKNIYKSDYLSQTGIFSFNNKIAQGVKTNLFYANASVRYLMNPYTNSAFSAQITYRKEKSTLVNNNDFIFSISFSTNLINYLREF
ncbi:MAG: hypothetical protein LC134_01275 [Chitinophagales bacterium]|nr:hypothetical protein [Chitinophagales bacterium]